MLKQLSSLIACAAGVALIGTTCTEIKYDNPIDINGVNKGEYILNPLAFDDDDADGIVNFLDPDSPQFKRDTTPPVIVLNGGDTVNIARGDDNGDLKKYIDDVTATDNSGVAPTRLDVESTVDIYSTNSDTLFTIKYLFQDSSSNKTSATRYVRIINAPVKDTKPPVITVGENPYYIQKDLTFTDPGVSVFDNHDGKIPSSKVTTTGTVNTKVVGKYILTYTVNDSANNSGTATREVIVQIEQPGADRINPVITLKGQDTIKIAETFKNMGQYIPTYVEAGCTANDNHDGDITAKVKIGTFAQLGDKVWYITYDVSDSASNNAPTVKRIFLTPFSGLIAKPFIDLALPDSVIQLILPTTGKAKWKEPGYTASDVTDSNLTSKVIVDSSKLVAHLDTTGIFIVTYTVTNSNNLTTIKERKVQIVNNPYDNLEPVITLLGRNPDTALAKSATGYKDPGYTALDKKDGDVTANVKPSGTVNVNTTGKYTISYSVSDKAGNIARTSRVVYVVRDTAAKDLLTAFVVPSETALPALLQKTYKTMEVSGDGGPDTSNIDFLRIAWDPTQNAGKGAINEFAIQKVSGNPTYVPMTSTITQTFGSAKPTLTISDPNLPDFKGTYYVTVIGKEFIWVEKTGKFAIIWGP